VAPNQQSAVVGKAIYVVGDVGYAAPTMADGEVRDSGTSVEVDAVPCALHPQTEVGFLVERRTDLKTFVDPVQIPEDWPPDREIATGCMVHITFPACGETALRLTSPLSKYAGPSHLSRWLPRLVDPTGHNSHIGQFQRAQMLAHQVWTTANVVIHVDDGFVMGMLPPIIACHRQAAKAHSVPTDNVGPPFGQLLHLS
jgi:hypothetical protein